ncbi:MAG: membrane protein insertion efficiency factor YidD [Campylobacteraceae bacterium]|nr:membrane protein insertion efficiency factor YidD [Campylobacteraceae bacterium]
MKRVFISSFKFYQKFISPLFPSSCRYYPSCSEYAIWQFRANSLPRAILFTTLRILRCNQLFKGGIDYPIVKKDFSTAKFGSKNLNIIFWFVPLSKGKYYMIKSLKKENNG